VKAALAAIKGGMTLAEVSAQFDGHQNQIQDWKKQLLDQAASVFGTSQERKTADEVQLKGLHAKIGKLVLETDFFCKSTQLLSMIERNKKLNWQYHLSQVTSTPPCGQSQARRATV